MCHTKIASGAVWALLCCGLVMSAGAAGLADGPHVVVPIERAAIVIPAGETTKGQRALMEAARELQEHLALVTGQEIDIAGEAPEGAYAFHVGRPAPGDDQPFSAEEARWVVGPVATYLYGHANRGTLFAVYGFLEDEVGVRWLEPGDRGIAYKKQSPMALRIGGSNWVPGLEFRSIRVGLQRRKEREIVREASQLDPYQRIRREFTLSDEAHNQYFEDVVTWRKRMRMGGHVGQAYGHAFTDWWERYGETHPEYFALPASGQRGPQTEDPTDRRGLMAVKLCPSNPKVADQIIENWLANPRRGAGINVCENDSPSGVPKGFCTCSNCQALDVVVEGQKRRLTDRYVHLANAVARKAREHDPDATVWMYAYNEYELPPLREKLEPNVVIGFVPLTLNIETIEERLSGWERMGMKKMFLRPNWPWYFDKTTIPLGYEKHFYDLFQAAFRHGLIGTDYDCFRHYWPVTGLAIYIQARAFSDPDKPFEHWENHYCSAYGAAAEDVKRYYRYWREELWEKRLREAFAARPRWTIHIDGLMASLDKYYRTEDFDATDAILEEALRKNLSDVERTHLEPLALANRHARLVFDAAVAEGDAKLEKARTLLEFRGANKDKLSFRWEKVFQYHGDLLGLSAIADDPK